MQYSILWWSFLAVIVSVCRPDTQRIFVDIGYGFHVEFTWDEALNYIPLREELLARLKTLLFFLSELLLVSIVHKALHFWIHDLLFGLMQVQSIYILLKRTSFCRQIEECTQRIVRIKADIKRVSLLSNSLSWILIERYNIAKSCPLHFCFGQNWYIDMSAWMQFSSCDFLTLSQAYIINNCRFMKQSGSCFIFLRSHM